MISKLLLIHRQKELSQSTEFRLTPPYFIFDTCLRIIAVSPIDTHQPDILPSDEVYRGIDAYRFLLEVISGLHSPIIGETEVLGQFRQQMTSYLDNCRHSGFFFQQLSRQLYQDVKLIRQQHLNDIGSRSYGSLCRKIIQSADKIHFLGSGHLVNEILPWVIKGNREVTIHCRNSAKGLLLSNQYDNVSVKQYPQQVSGISDKDAVIIAAPVESELIRNWLGEKPLSLIDLRAESEDDPINMAEAEWSLKQCFAELETFSQRANQQLTQAKASIQHCAEKKFNRVVHRPFGWDDLCA